jgi:glycine/D-amino acid oxidase-like deaminating enzyme
MKAAVIGGGINGVMTAWAFARRGDSVDLYKKGQLMSATSPRLYQDAARRLALA